MEFLLLQRRRHRLCDSLSSFLSTKFQDHESESFFLFPVVLSYKVAHFKGFPLKRVLSNDCREKASYHKLHCLSGWCCVCCIIQYIRFDVVNLIRCSVYTEFHACKTCFARCFICLLQFVGQWTCNLYINVDRAFKASLYSAMV